MLSFRQRAIESRLRPGGILKTVGARYSPYALRICDTVFVIFGVPAIAAANNPYTIGLLAKWLAHNCLRRRSEARSASDRATTVGPSSSDSCADADLATRPEAPPVRREPHVPNSIATMRRHLIVALAGTLARCPCCYAPRKPADTDPLL